MCSMCHEGEKEFILTKDDHNKAHDRTSHPNGHMWIHKDRIISKMKEKEMLYIVPYADDHSNV